MLLFIAGLAASLGDRTDFFRWCLGILSGDYGVRGVRGLKLVSLANQILFRNGHLALEIDQYTYVWWSLLLR